MKKVIAVFGLLLMGNFVMLSASLYAQTVTVNLSEEFQTIRGFGGMNHTTWIKDLNEDNREKAFGNDPGEIGLSILRCHVDPNSSNFELELPTAIHAIDKGAIVFASPWNAPTSLLVPGSSPGKVDPALYGDYVTHLNSFNSYMENNGAALYAISVQNEPDYGEWTQWTADEMLDFMSNYAGGINNKVIAPESFQFRRAYTDPLLNNSSAAANLEIVGGHIYGGGLFDYPLAREKGKDVWMTEHLLGSNDPSSNTWDLALVVGKEINDCMEANFNAYVWWFIRRFYGLISDDGNITNKGYVLSQYSKFVRNGAIRVGVDYSAVNQVDITAYKTDTTLVIVAVNRNSTNIDLNFNIVNSNVTELTQYSSSATKRLENVGEYTLSGGEFTATLAPKSVTTFTSHTGNAGKQGNLKPTANAGEDIILDDTSGTGFAELSIDGSSSSDSDGEITNFSWSLNGQQVSWEASHELSIDIGEYDLVLTVTDNDGATDSDTVKLTLSSSNTAEFWFEAECGTVGDNWQILSDESASQGTYVVTTNGVERIDAATTDASDLLEYNFTVSEASNYKVWARVITPSANDDSFWVKIDDSGWALWNSIPAGTAWHWEDVHDQSNNNDVMFYLLDPGEHTLYICMREDGSKLDKILISNIGLTPGELGGEADGCIDGTDEELIPLDEREVAIAVYPNPSVGIVNISWKNDFNHIQVFNSSGASVLEEHLSHMRKEIQIKSIRDPGIYFVLLRNEKTSGIRKFIIN